MEFLEESVAQEITDRTTTEPAETPTTAEPETAPGKELLLEELRKINLLDEEQIDLEEVARLKRQFYIRHNEESQAKYQEYIAQGGNAEDYVADPDTCEAEFKNCSPPYATKSRPSAAA